MKRHVTVLALCILFCLCSSWKTEGAENTMVHYSYTDSVNGEFAGKITYNLDSQYKPFFYFSHAADQEKYLAGERVCLNLGLCEFNEDGTVKSYIAETPTNSSLVRGTWVEICNGKELFSRTFPYESSTYHSFYTVQSGFSSVAPLIKGVYPLYGSFDRTLNPGAVEILDAYFQDGSMDNVLNQEQSSFPEITDSNVVEDAAVGHLEAIHVKEKLVNENNNSGQLADDRKADYFYDFDWRYSPATGSALEVPDENIRVEIKVDVIAYESYVYYKAHQFGVVDKLLGSSGMMTFDLVDLWKTFGDYPTAISGKGSYSQIDLQKKLEEDGVFDKESGDAVSASNFEIILPQYFYFRPVVYDADTKTYHAGIWYQYNVESMKFRAGTFDEDGDFKDNDELGPSYSIDPTDGTITGGDVPDDWLTEEDKKKQEDLAASGGWGVIGNFIESMKDVPDLIARVFSFLPKSVIWAMGSSLLVLIARRVLFG